jgi:hypothetical protein
VVLGADLDAAAGRQCPRDRGELVGTGARVDVQPEVGQVHRQPRVTRQPGELAGQARVVVGDPLGHGRVVDQLAELVDAAGDAAFVELAGDPDGVRGRAARDVPRRRPPRELLPPRHGPDHLLPPRAGRQPEQHRTVDRHGPMMRRRRSSRRA